MATISVGHQLYLYWLFAQTIGLGRQTPLSKVEEALAADDIMPCDLSCFDTRELLEKLSPFVRLTVFKKGRVYVTVVAQPEWDEALERSKKEDVAKQPANKGANVWKRKRGKASLQPVKPRPKNRPKPQQPEEEKTESPEATTVSVAPPDAGQTTASEQVTQPEAEAETEQVTLPANVAQTSPAPEHEHEPAQDSEPAPESYVAPKQEPATAPEQDPLQAQDPESTSSDDSALEVELSQLPTVPPAPEPAEQTRTSQQEHPVCFAHEVQLTNEQLGALYQILPLDVDPLVLLDEDWRVARSTSSFDEDGGTITFPLRYVHTTSGEPVRVAMHRGAPSASGKRWIIDSITTQEDVGFEGLPTTGAAAERELAQFAVLGSWTDLTLTLNHLKDPDCGPTNAGDLQEYLALTFHRVRLENKIVTYANDSVAVFDTGLLSTDARRILMCFVPNDADITWKFFAFAVVGASNPIRIVGLDGELEPDALAQLNGPLPEPASYLHSLADIAVGSETEVRVRKNLVRTYGPEIESAIRIAVRRARRDYRLATPAYDPAANRLDLLLPLCLGDTASASHAVVLARQKDGGLVASSVLSLERAATCARVVSHELPSWLV